MHYMLSMMALQWVNKCYIIFNRMEAWVTKLKCANCDMKTMPHRSTSAKYDRYYTLTAVLFDFTT